MSEEQIIEKHVFLPFLENEGKVLVAAKGKIASVIVNCLGFVLKQQVLEGNAGETPDITIADGDGPADASFIPWSNQQTFPVKIFWQTEPVRFHVMLVPDEAWQKRSPKYAMIRRSLYLASIIKMLRGRVSMMHGALLQLPDNGETVVVFGESGIGKSTLSRRLVTQGGCCLADDMSILTFTDDNRLLAQPCPTWSAIFEREISVDFASHVEVKAMLHLQRGENDLVVPENPVFWRLGLVGGMVEFLTYPANWLDMDVYRLVMERNTDFTRRCVTKYPPYCVMGDLNGHIVDNLKAYFRDSAR